MFYEKWRKKKPDIIEKQSFIQYAKGTQFDNIKALNINLVNVYTTYN